MDITIFVLCALFGAIFGYQIRAAKDMEDEEYERYQSNEDGTQQS